MSGIAPATQNPPSQFQVKSSLPPLLSEEERLDYFKSKGFTFSFVKSLKTLNAGGFDFKVPVTGNFPNYDSKSYLPRVVTAVGVQYPLDYKYSVTFSFPLFTTFLGFLHLAHKLRLTNKNREKEWKSSKDVNRRVGVSMSVKYNQMKGFRFSTASFLQQYSPKQLIEAFVPFLLFFPFLIISLFHTLYYILSLRAFRTNNNKNNNSEVNNNNGVSLINDLNGIYKSIYRIFVSKNPTFIVGVNAAISGINNPVAFGSDAVFELHNFFPIVLEGIKILFFGNAKLKNI